jgi:hypothetical protein
MATPTIVSERRIMRASRPHHRERAVENRR